MPASTTKSTDKTTTTTTLLTMNELLNARQNLSTIDLALGEIRRLLETKESLEADIRALHREKEELTQEVRSLRDDPTVSASISDDENDNNELDYNVDEMTRSERKAKAPDHFICPLTLQIMKTPMLQKGTNINYERGAILEWIYFGQATCPLTRQVLHPGDFVENLGLEREIELWRHDHGLMDDKTEREEMDSSELVQKLTEEQEQEQQKRLKAVQIKRNGSHKQLLGLRDRILQKRDARVQRRMSQV